MINLYSKYNVIFRKIPKCCTNQWYNLPTRHVPQDDGLPPGGDGELHHDPCQTMYLTYDCCKGMD